MATVRGGLLQPIDYATIIDDAGSGVTYVGKAEAGSLQASAVWKIFKMVESSGDLVITWADGNSSFDNVWNDRAILIYS